MGVTLKAGSTWVTLSVLAIAWRTVGAYPAVQGNTAPAAIQEQDNTPQDSAVQQLYNMERNGHKVVANPPGLNGPQANKVKGNSWLDRPLVGYDPAAIAMIKDLVHGVELAVERGRKFKPEYRLPTLDAMGESDNVDPNVVGTEDQLAELQQSIVPNRGVPSSVDMKVDGSGAGDSEEITQFNIDHSRLGGGDHRVKVGLDLNSSVSAQAKPVPVVADQDEPLPAWTPKIPVKRNPSLDLDRMQFGMPYNAEIAKRGRPPYHPLE